MDYIKKHKLTIFVIAVWILVVAFLYFLYKLFIGSSGLPVYGDRLDGIDKVPITKEQIKAIKENIEKEPFVVKVTEPYLSGKIFKVVITVADNAKLADSKALVKYVDAQLTKEQKEFYDVAVYLNKYYNCTLEATGRVDEEGNFVDNVTVKYSSDLSKNKGVEYGISNNKTVDYNKKQTFEIKDDGEYIIYGFTKDKLGASTCSIKINKKKATNDTNTIETTVNSVTSQDFPAIGYKKYGTDSYAW